MKVFIEILLWGIVHLQLQFILFFLVKIKVVMDLIIHPSYIHMICSDKFTIKFINFKNLVSVISILLIFKLKNVHIYTKKGSKWNELLCKLYMFYVFS